MQKKIFQILIFIIFWDSLVFYQIFFSPQVKQCCSFKWSMREHYWHKIVWRMEKKTKFHVIIKNLISGFSQSKTSLCIWEDWIHCNITNRSLELCHFVGTDPEILKRRGTLCRPPYLTKDENFRFQMV